MTENLDTSIEIDSRKFNINNRSQVILPKVEATIGIKSKRNQRLAAPPIINRQKS